MRILYMPKPMLFTELDVWLKPDAKRYASHLRFLCARDMAHAVFYIYSNGHHRIL